MERFTCPNCKKNINEDVPFCPHCGFDVKLYAYKVQEIYSKKIQKLDIEESQGNMKDTIKENHAHTFEQVHEVRCPFCNSSDLTRITAADKVLNIALFGLFGNKRRYQWHCNNCKTNW